MRRAFLLCSKVYVTLSLLFVSNLLLGQQVMLQGWYWDYPKTATGNNWTDSLNNKVTDLAEKGFTHIWLPPLSRASFGNNSNGYDPKDLYDLGGYGLGPTGFGTRTQVDNLVAAINTNGMKAVADVVYNHRDGGKAEVNGSVEGWIVNYNCTKKNNGDNPYPSDRVRMILPLGGSSLNGAGTYYFKIASASKHPDFYNKQYKFYAQTSIVGFQNLAAQNEFEPNGGGDCGQANNTVQLGRDMNGWIDNFGSSCTSGSCGVDEFALTVSSGQFNPAGDTLFVYLNNVGPYTDHFIYGIWSGARAANIVGELKYQTFTDFMNMPSGRGTMNKANFKPNGNPTNLGGDWDAMLFFYDYDQSVADTRQELIDWTQWLQDSVKINGLRMDAVKHFDYNFTADLLDSLHLSNQLPDMIVGEFFDFNASALKGWVDNVENNMLPVAKDSAEVRVFDFALRGALEAACDQNGYDVRNVFTSGVVNGAGGNKDQSVTFVNNHDFRDPGQMVDSDPELAYAYILTNPTIGVPTVFYPDYYGTSIPNSPNVKLKPGIDRLLDINTKFIKLPTGKEYLNRVGTPHSITYFQGSANKTLAYISVGGGDSPMNETITLINYSTDTLQIEFPLGSLSVSPINTIFFERTGKSLTPYAFKSTTGTIAVALPPRSYGIWANIDFEENCAFTNPVYVDKNATGSNDGGSWANAFTDLQSVLRLASTCPDIKEIWVKEGTYKPTFTNDRTNSFYLPFGVKLFGGFASAGSPTFAQRNPSLYPTVMSANIGSSSNSDNTYHALTTSNSVGDSSLVDGFTLSGGNANGPTLEDQQGGGLFNSGKTILENCKIIMNTAIVGSAIFNSLDKSLTLKNTIIQNNTGSVSVVQNSLNGNIIVQENVVIKE
jgi:glycosidase